VDILIGIIVLLGGGFLFVNSKRKTAEGLLQNQETKEKLLDIDKSSLKDQAALELEKQKTEALREEHEKPGLNEENVKNILNFFNDTFNKK
jgi:hypothetical protein